MAVTNTTAKTKYLIIGGGLAAASAIEELIKADESAKGSTLMVTAEAEPPYNRPPLSKGYFLGKESLDDILVHPKSFYEENGIEVWYQKRARLIDPATKVCELELNKSVAFEKALIVTGASVNRYNGPGRSLEGIHYLRNIQDSGRLKKASETMNEMVLIGSSFISMELASCLSQKGVKVTVVGRETRPWDKLGNPGVSDFFRRYFEKRNVRFLLDDDLVGFVGTGHVETVETKSGQRLRCDGVALGIGVQPNAAIGEASRMEVNNGIMVDEKLQTTISDIYAAGDVANFMDPIFAKRWRVEHWDNAQAQGQTAGRNLAGSEESFHHLPMFFSDIFDLSWELWGDPSEASGIVNRTEISEKSISSWYIKDGVINAALLMGRPAEESEAAQKLIESRTSAAGKESILRDPNRKLADLF